MSEIVRMRLFRLARQIPPFGNFVVQACAFHSCERCVPTWRRRGHPSKMLVGERFVRRYGPLPQNRGRRLFSFWPIHVDPEMVKEYVGELASAMYGFQQG